MHGVEFLAAALGRIPTRLISTLAPRAAASTDPPIADIGLHRVDLADAAERLEMPRELGPAHRDADAVMTFGQRADHGPAEETRAAEDRDQLVLVRLGDHGFLSAHARA